MNKKKKTLGEWLTLLLINIGIAFYAAFVFMRLYNWFIPAATGWGPINYWLSFGIITLVDFLLPLKLDTEEKEFTDEITRIILKVFAISLFFGLGALFSLGV